MREGRARTVAVLGAGPVGLEAALAAHDAGLEVDVYEAAPRVAANVRSWSHVRLFTPWEMNVSRRARRHLERAGAPVPEGDACPTGGELVERLLEPLAGLPWIAPRIHTGTRVRSVGREGLLKSDEIGTGGRAGRPFRILLADANGEERVERPDLVLDCTGTWHNPNPLGAGGIPAPGEAEAEDRILRAIPGGEELSRFAGRRVLLVGEGHSAQTAARLMADRTGRRAPPEVTWVIRSPSPDFGAVDDDPLAERARLTRAAASLARDGGDRLRTLTGTAVEALRAKEDGVVVTLSTPDGTDELTVDHIVSLTGSVGDSTLHRQLQVHECYATSGPMNLAAALLGASGSGDCLIQPELGAETLRNPEPDFFILGSKSYGRNSTFLLQVGWEQVDHLFGSSPSAAGDERALVAIPGSPTPNPDRS